MLDLADFGTRATADEGVVMPVENPKTRVPLVTPDGQPITITLASSHSERVRKVNRGSINKRLAQQRGGRPAVITAEGIEAEGMAALVAATIDWHGIVIGGETLPCTPENAKRAYTDLPWLKRQVDEFLNDEGNFVKDSSPTSAPSPSTSSA